VNSLDYLTLNFGTFIKGVAQYDLRHHHSHIIWFPSSIIVKMFPCTFTEWRGVVLVVRVSFSFFGDYFSNYLWVKDIVSVTNERSNQFDNLNAKQIVEQTIRG
jgi:general stress protein CsbA